MVFVVCRGLLVVGYWLFVVCCSLFVVRGPCVVRCSLRVVLFCRFLIVVRCSLCVVRCAVFVGCCLLLGACCLLFVV